MTFSSSVVFLLPVQLLLVVIGAVFIILSQCCGGGSQKKKTKAGAAVPTPQTSAAGGPPGAAEAPSSVKSPEKSSSGTNKVPPPSKNSSKKFSVLYKFKATTEYKTLTFDGLHIGVDELKKAICDNEKIRMESFDLLLTNAHTKRKYLVGELVPRNSSVVVQRIPRENADSYLAGLSTTTCQFHRRWAQHCCSCADHFLWHSFCRSVVFVRLFGPFSALKIGPNFRFGRPMDSGACGN